MAKVPPLARAILILMGFNIMERIYALRLLSLLSNEPPGKSHSDSQDNF